MSLNSHSSRRRFIVGSAVGIAAFASGGYTLLKPSRNTLPSSQSFVTAYKKDGQHFVTSMRLDGTERFTTQTPSACHSIATHASVPNQIIGISRDPGEDALLLDSETGKLVTRFKANGERHFNGHGTCSDDGQLFFASQNNYAQSRGAIAIYRIDTGEQLAEIDSHGIGPHELAVLSDRSTLVVANGGIQTHPETGRKDLNLPTMHPKLSYIDIQSGKLLQDFDLPDRKLSIRHLDVGTDDTVALALQYKGKRDVPPVVGFQKGREAIQLVKADSDEIHWKMNQYTASVCVHPRSGVTAITCPRGNLLTFWDSKSKSFLKAIEMDDPSGVSLSEDGKTFFITSATGHLYHVNAQTLKVDSSELPFWKEAHWGNHFSQLSS